MILARILETPKGPKHKRAGITYGRSQKALNFFSPRTTKQLSINGFNREREHIHLSNLLQRKGNKEEEEGGKKDWY